MLLPAVNKMLNVAMHCNCMFRYLLESTSFLSLCELNYVYFSHIPHISCRVLLSNFLPAYLYVHLFLITVGLWACHDKSSVLAAVSVRSIKYVYYIHNNSAYRYTGDCGCNGNSSAGYCSARPILPNVPVLSWQGTEWVNHCTTLSLLHRPPKVSSERLHHTILLIL